MPGHFAANMHWLQNNSAHFFDRWVAIYSGALIASAATQEDLQPAIINHPYLNHIMILKIGRDYIT